LQERRALGPALTRVLRRDGRRLLIPAVAAVVVAGDQLAKSWAIHHVPVAPPRHVIGSLNLALTFNSGAAFSVARGITPIVEAVVVALVVWLLAMTRRASRTARPVVSAGLGLLLGGALGNLADRLFRHIPGHPGAVIDFIQAATWWPVFNVADASIVVGVIVVAFSYRAGAPS
jgi:signal peptidase II